ncbi:TfoX/Sxy family DNA transformation protein [Lonsdalea britannica]|uniref:TfoX/Sxy family DNA transformation protein n=1 Tax=Lonsdalea britannica TaxID=1082704 RepID=UPI0026EAF826|nr:TfoX/Sxy family DNA transformation protein [Lonsdalea britannica]
MKQLCEKRIRQSKYVFSSLGTISSRSQFGGYSIAADKIIFALVSNGELYLRASRQHEVHFRAREMVSMVYTNRGVPVPLNYYEVDNTLWNNEPELLQLASLSLEGARQDKAIKTRSIRLKDLPNLNHYLERQLWKAGIRNIEQLHELGEIQTFLRLSVVRHDLNLSVLLALAGAIRGVHQAALPEHVRQELTEWFKHHLASQGKRPKH